jgi:hypothetical protein
LHKVCVEPTDDTATSTLNQTTSQLTLHNGAPRFSTRNEYVPRYLYSHQLHLMEKIGCGGLEWGQTW